MRLQIPGNDVLGVRHRYLGERDNELEKTTLRKHAF